MEVRKKQPVPVKKQTNPERETLDAMVGKRVNVSLNCSLGSKDRKQDSCEMLGWLRWIGVFTIGLSDRPDSKVIVVFKHAIVSLGVCSG